MNYIFRKNYVLVLFVGIISSLMIGYYTYKNNLEKEQIQFNSITKNITQQIKNTMDTYKVILHSGLGLFEISSETKREDWHLFVKRIQVEKYFPGIQGLGYSIALRPSELEKHIKNIQEEGFPSYKINPEGKRDLYTSILYIEPFNERNKRAFGYDMYSEKNRRNAMNRTIETGLATLSKKVTLVQENGDDSQSGFLLYTPLYKKDMSIKTKEERYKAIKGFIYAVFRTKNFIDGALANTLETINIKMYDGIEKNKNTILYDSNNKESEEATFYKEIELSIDGHFWTFEITTKSDFFDTHKSIYSIILTILSLLITVLITLLVKRKGEIDILKDDALLNVSQGVMVTNNNKEIIYANKAFEDLTGYTREFIYGQHANFLQGKDTSLESLDFMKKKMKELKPFECELLNYRKDGSSFWNRLSVTPILDEKNRPQRYIGIQNDITEKKNLEESILFEKNLLENILNNTSAIITLIDMNGVMVKLNEYGKKFVGYTQKEISSEAYFWKKFIPLDIREDTIDIIRKAKINKLKEKGQNAWISEINEERIFEWTNQLIKDASGKTEYISSVGIDITNDVIAQEKHNKTQKQLALSAEMSGLVFWELNLKTNIFTFNDPYYDFLKTNVQNEGSYQLELNTYSDAFLPKKSLILLKQALKQALNRNKDYQDSFESKMIRRDNVVIEVLTKYFISYDKYGIPDKAYGTKYDLTKQKEKEQILIEAKKHAENASRVKTEFLANMSHEIRTPLNGIIGLTNLVLETDLTDTQEAYLSKSITSSEALLHVINDILDYSKIEANKIELEHIPFELDKILHQVTNLFLYEAQNKNIDFDCTVAPTIHNNLIGDPFRLNQILINLVGNAIKFTEYGFVHIYVDIEEIKKDVLKLNIKVRDTGIGISGEKQKKLFKHFSQVDTSNTREYGGSGLGLIISQKLAELMGGEIKVESQEDIGSIFSFTVQVEYQAEDYDFLSQDIKDKKVLLVNNNLEMKESLDTSLKMFRLNTVSSKNTQEALEILKKENFDFIIVVCDLLDKDGIKFIKIVNTLYSDKNIKIIIISSFSKKEKLLNSAKKLDLEIQNLLLKPFCSSTLLNVLVNNSDIKFVKGNNTKKLFAKGKVLLVEDNEINQLVAKQNLESFGLEVHIAQNGLIAVEMAEKENFDIIFMDLQMPIMDGLEASRKIRVFDSNIPIVALSAAVMEKDLIMTTEAMMNDHLAKPIDIEKLKEVIVRYLDTSLEKTVIKDKILIDNSIPGINLVELIERLNNNKELSYQMLNKFAEDKKDIVDELNSLDINSKEFDLLIHNIKGLSGNLSLVDIYKYSKELYSCDILEKRIELVDKLKESLSLAIKSIYKLITPKIRKLENESNFSKDEIVKDIKKLINDISKGTFIKQDRKNLIIEKITHLSNKDIANKLEQELSNFNYKNAQITLENIIGDLS